jgi:hypothetical protein
LTLCNNKFLPPMFQIFISYLKENTLRPHIDTHRFTLCCEITTHFVVTQQTLAGNSLPIIEVSRSHSDTPRAVALLWTSHQPDTETPYLTKHTTLIKDRHPCSQRDSNTQSQQASGLGTTTLPVRPPGLSLLARTTKSNVKVTL